MTRLPIDENTPRDRPILLHVCEGFSGEREWAHGYCRAWTIGYWTVDCGVGMWHSVETAAGMDHGDMFTENIPVEPDGWAPLPEETA